MIQVIQLLAATRKRDAASIESVMIQQLLSTLPRLAILSDAELASAAARRLLDECADALRLQLDCPQQELTSMQRDKLRQLSELVEYQETEGGIDGARLRAAAASALAVIRGAG